MKQVLSLALTILLLPLSTASAERQELTVDAIVASVNGEPITLHEVCARLTPPRKLSLKEASQDSEARAVVDGLIAERLIEAEAQSKRINVSDSEVKAYLNEVAARNNLTPEDFENALRAEHKSIEAFSSEVRIQILRSKLMAGLMQGGVAVSQEEIDSYLAEHPDLSSSGNKVKLSQIFISTSARTEADALQQMQVIEEQLKAGADFTELARAFSEAPEAREGGSLGVLAEADLNRVIFDAVFVLQANETSEIVRSPAGLHIFQVDERFKAETEHGGKLRAEIAQILQRQKLERKLHSYLTTELYQEYAVDKKI